MGQSRSINDMELLREFFKFFGTPTGLGLMGYVMLYGVAGMRSADEIMDQLQVAQPGRATKFEKFAMLREFGDHLRSRGLYLANVDTSEDVRPLARMLVDAMHQRVGTAQ